MNTATLPAPAAQPCPICGEEIVTNTAACSALCDAVLVVRAGLRRRPASDLFPLCDRVAERFEVDNLKLAWAVLKAVEAGRGTR